MPQAIEITRHHDRNPDENPWVHGQPRAEKIEVVPYNPKWPGLFKQLAFDIKNALGKAALHIEHVGSTAVPQLAAKPVIDIDLIVADPADENSYRPVLEKIGYDLTVREPSWHQHRCLRLHLPRVNLHVFGPDCPELVRHQLFRDWLCKHRDDRQRYERAKRSAAPGARHGEEYNQRKQPVIRDIYNRAFQAAGL